MALRLILVPLLSSLILSVNIPQHLYAGTLVLKSPDVTVRYEEEQMNMAREILRIYPSVRDELTRILKQEVDFKPEVVLMKERSVFRRISGNDTIIAFAVPSENLIVLDAVGVYTKPFTLETTLKHELCHLVLHRGFKTENIPRWFDEGVCQWASGGIAELVTSEGDASLEKAVVFEGLIGIDALERFPAGGKPLILAYEESRSVVEYIVSKYGKEAVQRVVEDLRKGDSMNEALKKDLSLDLSSLEKNWRTHLRRKYTWFLYVSNNIYPIIFFLAAVVTLYGFVRLLKKKRSYVEEDDGGGKEEKGLE